MALFGSSKKSFIGLDVGADSVKAALVEVTSKKSQVTNFIAEPIPNNPLMDGELIQPDALDDVINETLKKLKPGRRKVNVGLAGSSVMVKRVSIPKVDDHMLADQVRWEAEQYIPFDLGSVNLDFVKLNPEAGSETMNVLIVAAQKDYLRRIIGAVEASGYKVGNVDVNGFALANAFEYSYGKIQGQAVAILDVGAFFTHFTVVQNGDVVFCRDLPVGGSFFTQEIQNATDVSYMEAERFKVGPESSMPDVAAQAVENSLESVCDQVQGSYEFFTNTTQGVNITNIFLTGGASKTKGLQEAIQRTLDIPVEKLDPLRALDIKSGGVEDTEELINKGVVSLGLALRKEGDID